MVTDRDLLVLRALAIYFVLNRQQIQKLCFHEDETGRVTRRRLLKLVAHGLIQRQPLQMHDMEDGSPSLVYYPSRRGLEILAETTNDKRFLHVSSQAPQPHHVRHWLAVSDTHILIDQAISGQDAVGIEGWINEWDTVPAVGIAPEERYRLYTRIDDRLVCVPDAAFLLSLVGHKKVYYLEQDRNTSGVERVAASKTKGYAAMFEQQLHRRHFPQTTVTAFTILMIAPNRNRRDNLRRTILGKPGWELWRFVSLTDLSADSLLTAPILYRCDSDEGVPLVRIEGQSKTTEVTS